MRKINWDAKLSEDDIAWLRQTGIVGIEDRISKHQDEFGGVVPEVEDKGDGVTRSALDPEAGADSVIPASPAQTVPTKVDPTDADPQDTEPDDYDVWKVSELEAEVIARNEMDNTSDVEVVGTGSNGNVTKPDLIKGLRLWDAENPGALG
jgi:hypothetical protein